MDQYYSKHESLLTVLIVFVGIDYGSGVARGAAEGKLKSKIGLIGIAKKFYLWDHFCRSHAGYRNNERITSATDNRVLSSVSYLHQGSHR
nr:phage holin family protein [Brevibacillus laterosporus]